MQGGLAKSLHSPKQRPLTFPCPSSGVLFRLPSPGRSIIMAPLKTSCHGKPRTECRLLPSFSCYGPSVYPIGAGRSWRSSLSGANLFKGKPLKAAAYWYSVVKFPTFRRKACNKHTKFCAIFLGIKIPICRNHGYVCSHFGFPYIKHLKTGKKKNAAPYHDNALPKTRSLLYIQT